MESTGNPAAVNTSKQAWPWLSLTVLAVLILGYIVLITSFRGSSSAAQEGPGVGRHLQFLQLQTFAADGQQESVTLDSLEGHVTLINFWGTWCGPCQLELPAIANLYSHFNKRDDFRFYAVTCENDDEQLQPLLASTADYLREQRIDMPITCDQYAATRRALVATLDLTEGFAYPTTLLLDANGVVRGSWIGYDERAPHEMLTRIRSLLSEMTAKTSAN